MSWPGDGGFIRTFLQTYQNFSVKRVHEAEEVTAAQRDAWGLTNPAARLVLRNAQGDAVQSVDLGLDAHAVFISLANGAVGEVSLDEWNTLVPFPRSFLERLVFPFDERPKMQNLALGGHTFSFTQTDLKKPVEEFLTLAKTVEAEDIFPMPADTSATVLKSYGLDKPMGVFVVHVGEGSAAKPVTLSLGGRVPTDEGHLYLQRSDQPGVVYTVPASLGDAYAAALKATENGS
jgi:hypothetical protein